MFRFKSETCFVPALYHFRSGDIRSLSRQTYKLKNLYKNDNALFIKLRMSHVNTIIQLHREDGHLLSGVENYLMM